MDSADRIASDFDEGLTYVNDNGNLAISKEVLAAFRKLSEGTVVWERAGPGSGAGARRMTRRASGRPTDPSPGLAAESRRGKRITCVNRSRRIDQCAYRLLTTQHFPPTRTRAAFSG
ncbi:DUF6953 family protein [Streptomyces thinghirensis]|uniref:Uncharacterized protein n=1 Tax=Streptomyces thinghirensis TaxID=551547 RepID=A0ABP9SZT5_9ACTN